MAINSKEPDVWVVKLRYTFFAETMTRISKSIELVRIEEAVPIYSARRLVTVYGFLYHVPHVFGQSVKLLSEILVRRGL